MALKMSDYKVHDLNACVLINTRYFFFLECKREEEGEGEALTRERGNGDENDSPGLQMSIGAPERLHQARLGFC